MASLFPGGRPCTGPLRCFASTGAGVVCHHGRACAPAHVLWQAAGGHAGSVGVCWCVCAHVCARACVLARALIDVWSAPVASVPPPGRQPWPAPMVLPVCVIPGVDILVWGVLAVARFPSAYRASGWLYAAASAESARMVHAGFSASGRCDDCCRQLVWLLPVVWGWCGCVQMVVRVRASVSARRRGSCGPSLGLYASYVLPDAVAPVRLLSAGP